MSESKGENVTVDIIRAMRQSASRELAMVLNQARDEGWSEIRIRDAWHRRLTMIAGTCPEGWYLPPPHGLAVLIGHPPTYERVSLPTFRPRSAWPAQNHRLSADSLLMAYSSRVHRTTGVIGDMACSVYFGDDQTIKEHLRAVWNLTLDIARLAEPEMRFSRLYQEALRLIHELGLTNDIYSVSDRDTNIGHTLPWTEAPIGEDERFALQTGEPERIADLVSSRRRFISRTESTEIPHTGAITIEPRLHRPGLPAVVFHVVVAFTAGQREIITEFDPLFELSGFGR